MNANSHVTIFIVVNMSKIQKMYSPSELRFGEFESQNLPQEVIMQVSSINNSFCM